MNTQPLATQSEVAKVGIAKTVAHKPTGGFAPDLAVDTLYTLYVDFVACGGLQVLEDGEIVRLKMQQFIDGFNDANSTSISRTTIWRRREADPQFDSKVQDRRAEIFGRDRVAQVWRGVMLQAMKGNPMQAEMFLANFDPRYIVPSKKVEISATGLADVLQLMRKRQNAVQIGDSEPAQLPAGE